MLIAKPLVLPSHQSFQRRMVFLYAPTHPHTHCTVLLPACMGTAALVSSAQPLKCPCLLALPLRSPFPPPPHRCHSSKCFVLAPFSPPPPRGAVESQCLSPQCAVGARGVVPPMRAPAQKLLGCSHASPRVSAMTAGISSGPNSTSLPLAIPCLLYKPWNPVVLFGLAHASPQSDVWAGPRPDFYIVRRPFAGLGGLRRCMQRAIHAYLFIYVYIYTNLPCYVSSAPVRHTSLHLPYTHDERGAPHPASPCECRSPLGAVLAPGVALCPNVSPMLTLLCSTPLSHFPGLQAPPPQGSSCPTFCCVADIRSNAPMAMPHQAIEATYIFPAVLASVPQLSVVCCLSQLSQPRVG
eukprot:GGOE01048797.1.p1 GENE.GGOE01048797.1~~GGOE01048797.1.p1  ORF type:complete len:352 (-),score=-9.81 GGOE01048797.1:1005-2060(-)